MFGAGPVVMTGSAGSRQRDSVLQVDISDGSALVRLDSFDSDAFGRRIARIVDLSARQPAGYGRLLIEVNSRAREAGFSQLLRRTPIGSMDEVWALERGGFQLLDVGVTFSRRPEHQIETRPEPPHICVADREDMEEIVSTMAPLPWGSRYEADPEYHPTQIQALRAQWLWNSFDGRADRVFVAKVDGVVVGYATCVLDTETRAGDIELVGTFPQYRGRGIATHLVGHIVSWLSARVVSVTVRTQASNVIACGVYERAGFVLASCDLTFRKKLDEWSNA